LQRDVCCDGSVRTVETLDQRYVLMPAAVKDAYLVHIVHEYVQKNSSSSVMIFTNTCKSVPLSSLLSTCPRRFQRLLSSGILAPLQYYAKRLAWKNISEMTYFQSDHSPGEPGNVRELQSGQGKSRENGKSGETNLQAHEDKH